MSEQRTSNPSVVDPELREGFKVELEAQMIRINHTLEDLIDMHDRYGGETMQLTYLYKARHALTDGLSWFAWYRRREAIALPRAELPATDDQLLFEQRCGEEKP